ncbi:extensin [Streptomyces sp. F63]|uniref:extensin n=1 Tax=Streptomyces sp. F63 TaxID=2824887 RepID=UPI001B398EC3|nr:extensin [Streptomyces sp. F63]MBQ0987771.1 extensin [Streptomyces sp. F63]
MKQVATREAIGLLRSMTWVLSAVAILALVFTTVNVTRFATSRGVPLPIAILLDPMIGTALAGVLYVDARLASWGIRPPTWSTALRWGAGCTAALMNSWESLWPDGQIGWPRQADPAAVLLHLTPALLLIALTETIAAYRRTVTALLSRIGSPDPAAPSPPPASPTATADRSVQDPTDPDTTDPDRASADHREGRSDCSTPQADHPVTSGTKNLPPHTGDHAADNPDLASQPQPDDDRAGKADVWPFAVALDNAARAATGKPVSIWRLRTDLRIGPQRARQIREQLLTRHPPDPAD